MDFGTRTKQLAAKEKARRRKYGIIFAMARITSVSPKNFVRVAVRMLRMGLVFVRVWRGLAVGISPTERPEVGATDDGSSGRKELSWL